MEVVKAYIIFAKRYFEWAVGQARDAIEGRSAVLSLAAHAQSDYFYALSLASQYELFNAMIRKNIYVHRARESREIPFSSAVDRQYWLSIGGSDSELDAYDRWWLHGFGAGMGKLQAELPRPPVLGRELRAALLPHIREVLGVPGSCAGYQCGFREQFNGWQMITLFDYAGGMVNFSGDIIRAEVIDPKKSPVYRDLPYGPTMPMVFPGCMFYSPTDMPRAIEAVRTILPLQWKAMEQLTIGLGPDDPDEIEQGVADRNVIAPICTPRLTSKQGSAADRTTAPQEQPFAPDRPIPRLPSYDLYFLRSHGDVDISWWLEMCQVQALILGVSRGWTAAVIDAPFGSVPHRMIESNPGYLISDRMDGTVGWSFDIFDQSAKVCSFSADSKSDRVMIDSTNVYFGVIQRLSALTELDCGLNKMLDGPNPVGSFQLKLLGELLTDEQAWMGYSDDVTPDWLFAEVLRLTDFTEVDDFDGLSFDRLFREYVDDPDMFRESFPNAKLVSPSSP